MPWAECMREPDKDLKKKVSEATPRVPETAGILDKEN